MRFNDLRLGWRQLIKEPGYSAVVVFGLAFAVAAGYLVALLLVNQWLPDPQVKEPDRVVLFDFKGNIPGRNDDWFGASPFVLRDAMLAAKAPLTASSRVSRQTLSTRAGERLLNLEYAFVDPGFEQVFSIAPLRGDLAAALTRPDAIALTTAAAEKLFGTQDVVGRRLRVRGHTLEVVALLPRPASSAQVPFEAVGHLMGPAAAAHNLDEWYAMSGRVFARLAPGATVEQVSTLLQRVFDTGPGIAKLPPEWSANGRKAAFLRVMALPRLPFDGAGHRMLFTVLAALGVVALIVLALASINYINLSSVRILQRQREIAIRKALGASPARLVGQFVIESCLVAVLAGALGLGLAWVVAPSLAALLDIPGFDERMFGAPQLLGLFGGCLLLGLLTGLYPARVALGIHCAPALQGRKQSESRAGRALRRVMTTLQFGAAITLSGAALVVLWQTEHMNRLERGFETRNRIGIYMPGSLKTEQARALRDALAAHPAVRALSWSEDVPGVNTIGMVGGFAHGQTTVTMRMDRVERSYFATYGIRLVAGQLDALSAAADKDAEQPVVLDTTAVRALGFASPAAAVGAQILGGGDFLKVSGQRHRIVAVVERIRQETARDQAQPQLFFTSADNGQTLSLKGDSIAALRAAVEEIWPRYVADELAQMESVDEMIAQNYRLDRNIGRAVAGAGLLALLLAGFGVYALAAYTVRRSTLEIVIRKLHGAGRGDIAARLAREFAPLVATAALLALPLTWWIAQQYLGGFVERAPMGGWPLVLALGATLAIALLASLRHVLLAMGLRPALALAD